MSPQSLLFSSDEETSRRLTQALQELELQVVRCTEIFDAVEKITTRSYDVIVADWDDGVEASFLLKTARELKLNSNAFTMAIANAPEAHAAARLVGANLVLGKPIIPDQAKLALLSCDDFLRAMKNWLPRLLPAQPAQNARARVATAAVGSTPAASASPPPSALLKTTAEAVPAAAQRRVALWPYVAQPAGAKSKRTRGPGKLLLTVALGVAFFSVGYVSSEPARGEALASSVTRIYERAVEKTAGWLQGSKPDSRAELSELAQATDPEAKRSNRRITVTPVYGYNEATANPPAVKPVAKPQPEPPAEPEVSTTAAVRIPDSLKAPIDASTAVRNVASRITPTLLGALEPVSVPEDLARRLILQKVDPSYPEQALRAGLQGPVVLQALISRDGSIRDLKLVHGSLLLGKAAYQAVKQWRYKPYLLNGQAVEAQTYVTVDFRLPQ
ncbi:MAG: TonB family protein [Acidobacteriia bacterium]|nr:TonB family protein [Terriglobia bacterium]